MPGHSAACEAWFTSDAQPDFYRIDSSASSTASDDGAFDHSASTIADSCATFGPEAVRLPDALDLAWTRPGRCRRASSAYRPT